MFIAPIVLLYYAFLYNIKAMYSHRNDLNNPSFVAHVRCEPQIIVIHIYHTQKAMKKFTKLLENLPQQIKQKLKEGS